MLVRISDKYVVNINKVLSAHIIVIDKSRPVLQVSIESETGEITRDAVSFPTYDDAKSALDKITTSSLDKDLR